MFTNYIQKLRLFNRDVRLYLITAVLIGLSYMGIFTVLFNLYLLRLGYGPEFIGLVNAVALLAYAIFCLPAGVLGRLWGVRRILIVGMSLMAVGLGLSPLVELIPTVLWGGWLLSSLSLSYLGASLYMVNGNPFLMGATNPEERNHAFSVRAALWPLGGFVGSLVGGFLPGFFARGLGVSLNDPAPYRYSLSIAGVLLIPTVLLMLATREVRVVQAKESRSKAGTAPYGLIALMAFVSLLRESGVWGGRIFFNVYLDAGLNEPTSLIGALTAVGQLVAVPAALAAPLLVNRWGKGRTIVLGIMGTAFSVLLMALIPHWGAAGLGFMGLFATSMMVAPAFSIFHQEIVSPAWRAPMSGAVMMAMGVSASAIAFGGGFIITALGYRTLFLIPAGLTAAGALIFWAYFRVPRGELARSSTPD